MRARPNETLLAFAGDELKIHRDGVALDLGCGAGRNALPLARRGWKVVGFDLSWPMLLAAEARVREEGLGTSVLLGRSGVERLALADASCALVVAHGIWNLARSGEEMRGAMAEAARVARAGAGLFVFTFSRSTLPADARPVAGERFVFTEFSGEPQCFLSPDELRSELAAVGFDPDPAVPLREHNAPGPATLVRGGPAILEGTFRRRGE